MFSKYEVPNMVEAAGHSRYSACPPFNPSNTLPQWPAIIRSGWCRTKVRTF